MAPTGTGREPAVPIDEVVIPPGDDYRGLLVGAYEGGGPSVRPVFAKFIKDSTDIQDRATLYDLKGNKVKLKAGKKNRRVTKKIITFYKKYQGLSNNEMARFVYDRQQEDQRPPLGATDWGMFNDMTEYQWVDSKEQKPLKKEVECRRLIDEEEEEKESEEDNITDDEEVAKEPKKSPKKQPKKGTKKPAAKKTPKKEAKGKTTGKEGADNDSSDEEEGVDSGDNNTNNGKQAREQPKKKAGRKEVKEAKKQTEAPAKETSSKKTKKVHGVSKTKALPTKITLGKGRKKDIDSDQESEDSSGVVAWVHAAPSSARFDVHLGIVRGAMCLIRLGAPKG
ncbi:MAG: hypothetical protein M1823_001584 [Watsoniomyces obsoletus]|nr:MAG: hypothetical protein M1823_001584 [Watsoniomyces obsoletus]